MFNLIGLGLHTHDDISIKSYKIVQSADYVYLEAYTCIINNTLSELERFFNKSIILANRHLLENTNEIVEKSKNFNVVLLVPGTPLFATTHTDLILRCKKERVQYKIDDNSSIFNVIGHCGLFSYNFGRVVSIPFFTEKFKPFSLYDKIYKNIQNNLHTLCLLDIKINSHFYLQDDCSLKSAIAGTDEEAENRFMTANTAIDILFECEKDRKYEILDENTKIFVICRFGHDDQEIIYNQIKNLRNQDFGKPLHSLIVPAKIEEIENEHVEKLFSII